MRRSLLLSLGLAVTAACGGDSPSGPAPVPRAIVMTTDTVRVGAALFVRVDGMRVTADTTSGTLGGMRVTLARGGDSSLVLVTPAVAAGTQTLAVALAGDTLRASVTVLPALVIADAEASLLAALDAQVAAIPVAAPFGTSAETWALQRARVDSLVAETRTELAKLTADEQLALARLVASAVPAPAAPHGSALLAPGVPSRLFFKDGECGAAQAQVARTGIPALYSLLGLVIFIQAPPVNPLLKYGGAATMAAAFAASMMLTLDHLASMTLACNAQKTTDLSDTPLDVPGLVASAPLGQQTSAGPHRFFTGRARTYYPVGQFRPLSTEEVAQDARVAKTSRLLDDLHAAYGRVTGLLPDAIATKMPALPPRFAAPGPSRLLAVPRAGVRIENVRPSSVQLTAGGSGHAITLAIGATITDDVPFSYDVVSTYDPNIRITRTAVARPFMSATVSPYPTTVTGNRTTTTDSNGNRVGTLSCGGAVAVNIKGGDVGQWGTFGWTISGPGTLSETTPIRTSNGQPARFESGSHPFSGSWYWSWTENGEAVFKPFTVTVTITYTDLVTGQAKSVPQITFNCV